MFVKIFWNAVLAILLFFLALSAPSSRVADETGYLPQENDAVETALKSEKKSADDKLEKTPEPVIVKDRYEEILPAEQPKAVEENWQESDENPTAYLADSLPERQVNKKSIVAIQCVWDYTYPENVSEDSRFHSETYYQGSGIVISESGHILTVNHVLDSDLEKEPDETGKNWFLKECQAALTDGTSSPLPHNSPRFKEAEIIFQPSSEYYDYNSNERVDFDFALLKFKEAGKYGFAPLFPGLMDSEGAKTSMFLMGYPGAELTGKREFKTLEFFSRLKKYRGRNKGNSAFFYQAGSGQFSASSESYKKFQEDLFASGQDTRRVKGGFSGSPVFVRGYLAGITISSSLPYVEAEDMILVISSYSIFELLEKNGIVL